MNTYDRISRRIGQFQEGVWGWLNTCFGKEISEDLQERNRRFLEEALELVQAGEHSREEAHWMVDYVYDRPVGEVTQEVGGVFVTLSAFCAARKISLGEAATTELIRIWSKVAKIRAKQKAKPVFVAPKSVVLTAKEVTDIGLYWFRDAGSDKPWGYMSIERIDDTTLQSGFLDRFEYVKVEPPKQ